ncbi:NnrS family protein [bacterium]|nr:NnrS family protein [bacterium]MBU1993684.1 NnrS family protein [bacterium]
MKFQTPTKKENYFLSQPHQPFFILGITNALVMMLIFALSYKNILTLQTESLNFHVYSLIFLVFTNVFTGFLFTTFPRFCQAEVIKKKYYANIFYYSVLGSLVFLFGLFMSHALMLGGMAILFFANILIVFKLQDIYKTGIMPVKQDPFWILTAMYFGLLGHFLFIEVELQKYTGLNVELLSIAINISFYMYLIFLGFSVAQRMVPFFSHSFASKNENFIKIIFVLFLLKSISSATDMKIIEILTDLLLAVYMLIEFLRWKLPLFRSPAILWVLHLALFWLPTALFLSALSLALELFLNTSLYFFNIHLLAIGFLTTILIGFGTRVTLGHSGQAPHADTFVTNIFWFIQAVVVLRALYSLNIAFEWGLNFLFDISLSAWLFLFLVWGLRYGKVLMFGSKI